MDSSIILEKAMLVLERLQTLQRPDFEDAIAESMTDGGKAVGLHRRDFGMEPWDWPQGVGLLGMYKLYQTQGDAGNMDYLIGWFKGHLKNGLPLRNINTGAPLLTMSYLLERLGADARKAAADWAEWLMHGLPRTKEGGFQHTTTKDAQLGTLNMNEGEIWVDTLFMSVLFLARYAIISGNAEYRHEAVHQFLMQIKYLYDKTTGLFFHDYTFLGNHNFGQVHWCRGNCWFTAAVMEFIDIMGEHLDGGVKAYLLDTYRAQVEALCALQSEIGLWHTVLNDRTSYLETSGSAGIAYGILKGIHAGYLDSSYKVYAEKALGGIIGQIGADGTVGGVSAGTRIGDDAQHYKNILIAPMAYGQSLVLMALAEALRD